MHSALAPTSADARADASTRWLSSRRAIFCAALGLLWFILCRDLSLEWSANEQYSYGWFVPFFVAFLFWLRWEDFGGTPGACPPRRASSPSQKHGRDSARPSSSPKALFFLLPSAFLLLLLFPIRLFEVANPDWRPLSWLHALAVVGLTLLAIGYWGGWPAVKHFAFPVCFILVAVPWLTPIEAPLVQWLMRIVAAVATETLNLFGIPAQLEGSLIRVNSGVVGVSEACSGVRSLQTSLMIGLLFGELKRLTIARRFGLVAAALTIALLANFGRAFFLVWIAATENLAAVERWHDFAGYAIVGLVFLGTIAIAAALARGTRGEGGEATTPARQSLAPPALARGAGGEGGAPPGQRPHFRFPASAFLLSTFCWLLLVEVGVAAWYRAHEQQLVPARQWTVQWPEAAPAFRDLKIDEHTRDMLRFDRGREASWAVPDVVRPGAPLAADSPPPVERAGKAILFFFRWEPGTATILRARAHRPDICLPAVGWRQIGEPGLRSYPVGSDFALPFQHFRFVHDDPGNPPLYAETFFCLREDRIRAEAQKEGEAIPFSHWSIPERWEAVRQGLRNPGQQVLEFVLLSHHPLSAAEAQAGFATLVPTLVKTKR